MADDCIYKFLPPNTAPSMHNFPSGQGINAPFSQQLLTVERSPPSQFESQGLEVQLTTSSFFVLQQALPCINEYGFVVGHSIGVSDSEIKICPNHLSILSI